MSFSYMHADRQTCIYPTPVKRYSPIISMICRSNKTHCVLNDVSRRILDGKPPEKKHGYYNNNMHIFKLVFIRLKIIMLRHIFSLSIKLP